MKFKVLLLFLSLLLATSGKSLQAQMFIHFEGIAGAVSKKSHKNWCELESFTFCPRLPLSSLLPAGRDDYLREFSSNRVMIEKRVDPASPILAKKASAEERISKVKLHVMARQGGMTVPLIRYTFSSVLLSGLSVKGDAHKKVPRETVEFTYESVKIEYSKLDERGKKRGVVSVEWNRRDTREMGEEEFREDRYHPRERESHHHEEEEPLYHHDEHDRERDFHRR